MMSDRNVSETAVRLFSKLYRLYEAVVYGNAREAEELARELARTLANSIETMLQSLEKVDDVVEDRNVRNFIYVFHDTLTFAKIVSLYLAGSRKYLGAGIEKVSRNVAACARAFLDELATIYSEVMDYEFEKHSTNVVKAGLALLRILEAVAKSELTKFIKSIGKATE